MTCILDRTRQTLGAIDAHDLRLAAEQRHHHVGKRNPSLATLFGTDNLAYALENNRASALNRRPLSDG